MDDKQNISHVNHRDDHQAREGVVPISSSYAPHDEQPNGAVSSYAPHDEQPDGTVNDARAEEHTPKAATEAKARDDTRDPVAMSADKKEKKQRRWSFYKYVMDLTVKYSLLLGILLITALTVFLIFFQPTRVVSMPNLVGKSFVEAALLLQERQLHLEILERYTADPSDVGNVIAQYPQAGIPIRTKRTVSLTVSKGSEVSEVPDFLGVTLERVESTMQNQFAGFESLLRINSISKVFSDDLPQVVIGQDPPAGYRINNAGTGIDLIVSRGPISVSEMPDLIGLNFSEVLEFLAEKRIPFEFYLSTITDPSDVEREKHYLLSGVIVEQSPVWGEDIEDNTVLRIGLRKDVFEQEDIPKEDAPEPSDFAVKIFTIPIEKGIQGKVSVYKKEENIRTLVIEIDTPSSDIFLPYYDILGVEYEAEINNNVFWSYNVGEDQEPQ